MDRPGMYIFTIARSRTNRPSISINHVTPSSTDWPAHLQFNVQWIGRECTYSPLLGLIPTGHPNTLTVLLANSSPAQSHTHWLTMKFFGGHLANTPPIGPSIGWLTL